MIGNSEVLRWLLLVATGLGGIVSWSRAKTGRSRGIR